MSHDAWPLTSNEVYVVWESGTKLTVLRDESEVRRVLGHGSFAPKFAFKVNIEVLDIVALTPYVPAPERDLVSVKEIS